MAVKGFDQSPITLESAPVARDPSRPPLTSSNESPNGSARTGLFYTTHWSVVLAASDSAGGSAALEQLCRAYWMPVFVYARSCGWNIQDAEDLTQDFFHRLLDRQFLAQADPQKGRFRSFLLIALKHFLANAWDRRSAVKRGGRTSFISIEEPFLKSETDAFGTNDTPDQAFARTWGLVFLDRVMTRLRESLERSEQREQFDALKHCLIGDGDGETYAQLAQRLGTTEGAIKMAVQRLRRRFASTIREEIAHTVTRPDEIEDEIRCLFAAVSR